MNHRRFLFNLILINFPIVYTYFQICTLSWYKIWFDVLSKRTITTKLNRSFKIPLERKEKQGDDLSSNKFFRFELNSIAKLDSIATTLWRLQIYRMAFRTRFKFIRRRCSFSVEQAPPFYEFIRGARRLIRISLPASEWNNASKLRLDVFAKLYRSWLVREMADVNHRIMRL